VKPLPPPTSKAGKDLAQKFKTLEERLTHSRDVRLPAAIDYREKLAAQGKPTWQTDDLIDELNGQVTAVEGRLAKLRAEYGIEDSLNSELDQPRGWDSTGEPWRASEAEVAARKAEVTKIIREVAGDEVSIRFNDQYITKVKSAEWGGDGKMKAPVAGSYNAGTDIATVNGVLTAQHVESLISTAYHEAFHRLQHVALSAKEVAVLDTAWARLRVGIESGRFDKKPIAYVESQAVAFQKYAMAKRAGQSPIEAMLWDWKPSTPLLKRAVATVASMFDHTLNVFEKLYNLYKNGTFDSTKAIFERARTGALRDVKESAGRTRIYEDKGWKYVSFDHLELKRRGDALASFVSAFRQVDDGKLKGISKRAMDAAEKGDHTLALAEATDYAKRRIAEIDNRIEDIKRRAIEEGC
jgi:hypothetical protein